MATRGGVDLGGTKIQTVIVDAKHEVLGQARRPTPTTGTPEDVKDAIAAALVEAADAAGIKTSELAGIGVGGGIVLDGKPWLVRGAAAEIGHMVVRINGARCPCGRRGCMEAYAGRAAMEAKARREVAGGRKTDLFEIMEKRGRERLTS